MGGKTNGQRDGVGQVKGRHLAGRVRKEEAADGPGFDCITEDRYENMEAFKFFPQFAMSEFGKVIFETEATFMDISKTVAGLVQETTTS
jgi:hypothetical protein